MNIREAQEALRNGVKPSPDYPDLPNDYTAEQLIAYDPKAELEYRMAKDLHPEMTRAKLMQSWKAFRIGSIRLRKKGGTEAGGMGFLRKAAEHLRRKPDARRGDDRDTEYTE